LLPSTDACNNLTRAHITEFRSQVRAAIMVLEKFNGDSPYAWSDPLDLRVVVDQIDETAFGESTCKMIFYQSGMADPNNIHACFRVDVAPHIEYAMYLSTLQAWYNKAGYPSRQSAVDSYQAVRDLLEESRRISNDALTCLFESTNDMALPPPKI
jgi:hypothetical protein